VFIRLIYLFMVRVSAGWRCWRTVTPSRSGDPRAAAWGRGAAAAGRSSQAGLGWSCRARRLGEAVARGLRLHPIVAPGTLLILLDPSLLLYVL